MLAAVVAVARSPSSAIAVVTELQADGPFTQTMLGVTMVTDVVVILLFTAAAKLGETMLDEGETDALAALAHFVGSTMLQLLLSMAHAAVLGVCCLLLLRVPLAPLARRLAVRELALLLLGGYAFALEPLVQRAVRGSGLEGVLRLEPMLACLTAGALVCNRWGQRRAFAALLRHTMPPVLCFFFVTTGGSMRISQLRRTWPTALLLVGARLASLYCGCALGSHCAAAPRIHRTYGWASYVTQARAPHAHTMRTACTHPMSTACTYSMSTACVHHVQHGTRLAAAGPPGLPRAHITPVHLLSTSSPSPLRRA